MAPDDKLAPKPTWADHARRPVSTAQSTTWDFAPFLSAPAVKSKSKVDGQVNLINIPQTKIPSPLANNISPRQLIDVRESLIGKDGESGCGGNGKEIWLSWKRAWDLWNNHYIEGRVNPVWVGEEWERREKAQQEWDRGRDERIRQDERGRAKAGDSHPADDVLLDPLLPEEQLPVPKSVPKKSTSSTVPPRNPIRPHRGHGRRHFGPDHDTLSISDDHDTVFEDYVEEALDSEPPPPPTTNIDGSSAGWFPMKELPEYHEPEQDNYSDEISPKWTDIIANTVWRPRRVCEKTLQIDLDKDIEEFRKTELNADGGFDCGRSPFPVLRPVTQYIRTAEGAYRKKKAWDGVTGTIFNMPTQPLEPCPETKDSKVLLVKEMYTHPFHNHEPNQLFPFDVRRVLKVTPGLKKPRSILEKGEELVRDLSLYPEKQYQAMRRDDPWWVEDSQKQARDVPPRSYPPQKEFETELGENLPLDDELWQEEQRRDLTYDAGYFVTNLHGATLIVNGMEIKKGDVAGPLPAFAIIECPGGQTSFWWGVGGRHYGAGPEEVDLSAKWEILRANPGWAHVAQTAGEVWDAKIRDRKEREKSGNEEEDDEEWKQYKKTKQIDKPPVEQNEWPQQLGCHAPVPTFNHDDEELEWLDSQVEVQRELRGENQRTFSLIYPDVAWAGRSSQVDDSSHEQSKQHRHGRWTRIRQQQLALQRAINQKIAKQKESRLRIEQESEKRKADEFLESNRKRRKLEGKARQEAAAKYQAREDARLEAERYKAVIEQVESQYLSDKAKIAATYGYLDLTAKQQHAQYKKSKGEENNRLEQERLKANLTRKKAGKPEVPPSSELDQSALQVSNKRLAEELSRTGDLVGTAKPRKAHEAVADTARVLIDANQRVQQQENAATVRKHLAEKGAEREEAKEWDVEANRQLEKEAREAREKDFQARMDRMAADSEADRLLTVASVREEREEQSQAAAAARNQAEELKQKQGAEKKVHEGARLLAENKGKEAKTQEAARLLAEQMKKMKAEKEAQEAAILQATQDGADRKRKQAAEAAAAQERADNLAKQQDTARREAAFDKTIQGRLTTLRQVYYATPIGPDKVAAAKAYQDRLRQKKTSEEQKSYQKYIANLTAKEVAKIAKTTTDTYATINNNGTGPVSPDLLLRNLQLPLNLKLTDSSFNFKVSLLSPSKQANYPSTLDEELQKLLASGGDNADPEFQKALQASFGSAREEARAALKVRADSQNMTVDEWAKSEGLPNAQAWLTKQQLAARAASKSDKRTDKKPYEEPDTEVEKDSDLLEKYESEFKSEIRRSLDDLAKKRGYSDKDIMAKENGYETIRGWATEEVEAMNLTIHDVPIRPLSLANQADESLDADRWQAWCNLVVKYCFWEERIEVLPSAPGFTNVKVDNDARTYADV